MIERRSRWQALARVNERQVEKQAITLPCFEWPLAHAVVYDVCGACVCGDGSGDSLRRDSELESFAKHVWGQARFSGVRPFY